MSLKKRHGEQERKRQPDCKWHQITFATDAMMGFRGLLDGRRGGAASMYQKYTTTSVKDVPMKVEMKEEAKAAPSGRARWEPSQDRAFIAVTY